MFWRGLKFLKKKADNGLRHQLHAELHWHHTMGAFNVSMDAERLVAVSVGDCQTNR